MSYFVFHQCLSKFLPDKILSRPTINCSAHAHLRNRLAYMMLAFISRPAVCRSAQVNLIITENHPTLNSAQFSNTTAFFAWFNLWPVAVIRASVVHCFALHCLPSFYPVFGAQQMNFFSTFLYLLSFHLPVAVLVSDLLPTKILLSVNLHYI